MGDDFGSADLASWHGAESDMFAGVGRVAAHPAFPAAARALAAGMLALAASDRALDSIFKDAGRYGAAMWGFALHEDGGLTLPRLKAVGARSGLWGPGRARALLQFLEHFDYLERRPGPRGAALYRPTPAFVAAWDRQFVAALQAAALIAPDLALVLDTTAARQTFGRIHAEGMMQAMQAEAVVLSFLRVFLHPFAGNHIIWTLVASDADPAFPPSRAGPVSVAGLARVCGTSRMQVARIFHEAATEGLADLDAEGFVQFHPPAREQLGFFYAIQLMQILAAAARAAQLHGLLRAA